MTESNQKFRFHVLAIPHTVTHHDYVACAYTQKVLKFCKMMTQRGHTVIHYGHADSDVVCSEHVTVTDNTVLDQAYGAHDWHRHQFRHAITDFAYTEFNRRVVPEIRKRAQALDFVVCPFGIGHKAAVDQLQYLNIIACEPGIGYTTGHFTEWRCYESHAVRTVVEGAQSPQPWYSWVIPNYFELSDFTYQRNKQDYVLYLGRVTELKGISTCIQATAHAGVELKIAGQGRLSDLGYQQTPSHVTELGYADRELRRKLMSEASALIIATNYLEPFGGVVVEALLSGTPIITPFFGAFEEINIDGVTGYKCHTMREYVQAIQNRRRISPTDCRARGAEYLTSEIAPRFEAWFAAIHEVYTGQGWLAV